MKVRVPKLPWVPVALVLVLAACSERAPPPLLDAAQPDRIDVPTARDAPDACVGVLPGLYRYGFEQPSGATTTETSTLAPPNAFRHARVDNDDAGARRECSLVLPGCGSGARVDVDAVARALGDFDVTAAFALAPVLFGHDDREMEGQVFTITRETDGAVVRVGSPCASGEPGCRNAPEGVARLVGLLVALQFQALEAPACATLGSDDGGLPGD